MQVIKLPGHRTECINSLIDTVNGLVDSGHQLTDPVSQCRFTCQILKNAASQLFSAVYVLFCAIRHLHGA